MKLKKIMAAMITAAVAGGAAVIPAFASTPLNGDSATIPAYLTQEATAVDVTVGADPGTLPDPAQPGRVPIDADGDGTADIYGPTADAVYIYAKANSNRAYVTDLVISNNNASAPVFVKGISIGSMLNGYSMQPFNTDFSSFAADSRKIGLLLTGGTAAGHDLSTAYMSGGDRVGANDSITYSLDGRVSASTSAVDLKQVASCVVTVAMQAAV